MYLNEVLNGPLKEYCTEFFPYNDFILQQDNCPCHIARIVKEYIAENNIYFLDWPAISPDVNPIKNIWSDAKGKLL